MLAIQELRGEGNFEVICHPDVPEGAVVDPTTNQGRRGEGNPVPEGAVTTVPEGAVTTMPEQKPVPEGEDAPPVEGDVIDPTMKQDYVFDSRTSLLKLVVESLVDADINVVGVYGPGGVGKSTLMKQVVNRVRAEKLFDEVAMATVSANPDLKRIQGEISDMLGLKFKVESVHGRGFQLRSRLEKSQSQNKKVLVILDDLWKELDLEEVGIPRIKGVKLLLTSRNQDVLSSKMGSQRNFQVEGLKDTEPWKLFRTMVGDIADDPKVKPIAEEVVEKCVGLPILLKALATTLKNSNHSQWEDALEQLRRSKDVYSSLELSYNNLESDELKTLFLICSSLGKGHVLLDDILVYTVGLGLFEGIPTMKRARERLNVLLHNLQASSLLLEYDDSDYVRIHDIVREVATIIASRDRHILVINSDYRLEELPREKIKQSSVISLPWVDVPELPTGLQCPELKMFLFFAENNSSRVPDSFFEGMGELRVLDFSCLSFNSLPSSMQFLDNLRTLCVDWWSDVDDVTVIGKLKRLQVLTFRGSGITRLPKEIAQLSELRILDLSNCSKLEKIEPGVLKCLARLEELKMENSFTKWENEGATERSNARLAELNNMPKLSSLDILIPDATLLPEDLPIGNLFNYRVLVGDDWDWSSDHKESRTLKLKLDSRKTLLEKWLQATLPRTHDLYLDGLRGIQKSIHELSIEGFQELKHLQVQSSPLVQYVIRSTKWLPCSAFPMLESLILENLVNLEKISHGHLALDSFSKLKVIKVRKCGKLKNLFCHSQMKCFSQLEEIDISACEMFREIVEDVGVENDEDEAMGNAKVEMPNLRRLTLQSLPEVMSLGNKVYNPSYLSAGINSEITLADDIIHHFYPISLPCLEALELSQLPKLDEIWWRDTLLELENLRALMLKDCGNLSSIFDFHSLTKLRNLESLTIESCMTVKQVFDLEELNPDANVRILPQLREMELVDLPDLRCMWSGNPKGVFQLRNLNSLKVTKCNSLSYLFPLSAAKALKQIKEIEIAECLMMEAIIIMKKEEGQATETLVFQSLSSIILEKMSHLAAFALGKYSISFPHLKVLKIEECPRMKAFSLQDYSVPSEGGAHLREENAAAVTSLSFFSRKELLPSLEDLQLVSMDSFKTIWHNEDLISEASSFRRLRYTHIRDCKNLTTVFPSALVERFQNNLKKAAIYGCPSVELIFETAAGAEKKKCNPAAVMLHELEDLLLDDLPKLKHVLDCDSHALVGFPNLEKIYVEGCHSLTYFLPFAMARNLLKLKSLSLGKSNNMLEVVANVDGGGGHDASDPISFPRLKLLQLWGLKSLISFSSGSCAFDFPSLEDLYIDQCNNLKTFIMRPATTSDHELMKLNRRFEDDFSAAATVGTLSQPLFDEKVEFPRLEKIDLEGLGNLLKLWDDELPLGSFCKLQSLSIMDCKNLPAIFQSNVIGSFLKLETLQVEDCDSLEEIFRLQGKDSAEISVPLRELKMVGLPRMKRVWNRDPQGSLTFAKLERVEAERCGKLEYLFPSSVARGLLQLQEIDILNCAVLEELVARGEVLEEDATLPPEDQLLFPRLISLKFRILPNLKRLFPVNYSMEWSLLKNLYAYECGKLKIFASELRPRSEEDDTDSQQALISIEQVIPNLESLGLGSEDVLTIQDSDFPDDIFRNLKTLCLASIREGSAGFPSRFLLDRFPDLEIEILVLFNYLSEEIFPDEALGPLGTIISYKDGYSNGGKYSKALGKLRELSLVELSNLRYVWKEGSLAAEILKRINSLYIRRCHCLKTLLPAASASFKNLTGLYIEKCYGLMYLMTTSAAQALPKLANMTIRDCEAIREVIAANDSEASVEISFPQLGYLALDKLPSLTCFSSASCSITFPSLEDTSVQECPSMKFFSSGAVSTPKLYQVKSSYVLVWFNDLNTTIQKLYSDSGSDS
ncbi:uncharacterized protein LOC116205415 [Punica granatum]|uniref:Uncharacterized protein LOC116205415 n=1 Tax=Punica granatum TaxID=22663 RepID=A0A6P8DKF8_PUNGR|nr:uncharacterized protein LOC116205415 [Punica granatum]